MANSSLNLISDLVFRKDDSKITVRISRLWGHIPASSKHVTIVNMILLGEKIILIFNLDSVYAYFVELLIYNMYCPYFTVLKFIHQSLK